MFSTLGEGGGGGEGDILSTSGDIMIFTYVLNSQYGRLVDMECFTEYQTR